MDSGKWIASYTLHQPSIWTLMTHGDAWCAIAPPMSAVEDILDYGVVPALRDQLNLAVINTLKGR